MLAATAAVAAEPVESPPPFKPGEISIGEPIALPLGNTAADGTTTPAASARADDVRTAQAPPQPGAVPGSGWLGLSVAESPVPGRWRVENVAADGPAARAGIAPGDELRAVDGLALANADEVSQALTAIAAGQDVRVAVARADQLRDVVLRAEPRPAPKAVEPPRFTAAPAAEPLAPPAAFPAPTLAQTSAPPVPPPASSPTAAPAAGPQWQSSPGREPTPPAGSRFGQAATPPPAAIELPPASVRPAAAAAPGRIALGVRTVPVDPATQARFQLREPTGAYVIGVVQELPAAQAGVPPGSVIVALGGQPVQSPLELTRLVTSGPLDRPVTVQFVLPGGEAKQAAVQLRALDVPLERALTGDGTTSVSAPTLQSGATPRRTERPAIDEGAIRGEIRALRARLERLEGLLLDPASRRGR